MRQARDRLESGSPRNRTGSRKPDVCDVPAGAVPRPMAAGGVAKPPRPSHCPRALSDAADAIQMLPAVLTAIRSPVMRMPRMYVCMYMAPARARPAQLHTLLSTSLERSQGVYYYPCRSSQIDRHRYVHVRTYVLYILAQRPRNWHRALRFAKSIRYSDRARATHGQPGAGVDIHTCPTKTEFRIQPSVILHFARVEQTCGAWHPAIR